jgi:hypothetical protein
MEERNFEKREKRYQESWKKLKCFIPLAEKIIIKCQSDHTNIEIGTLTAAILNIVELLHDMEFIINDTRHAIKEIKNEVR